ncbi:hypothetical protein E4U53_003944 [Claviceps sorghi]|nr:hypothetical protein E4U53_003944 [Claviceps sorghi]
MLLLLACPSGQLAALTPLGESTYRRLQSVTNQLHPAVVPHGGLHAKAHRHGGEPSGAAARTVGVDTAAAAGRTVVDGTVLARWNELGAGKRADVAVRGGYDGAADLRGDLEGVLGWTGMAYF